MKDYYGILEVNKNASKEIIEKAYKVLAKKYHPDVNQGENKAKAEEKMKLINEAYEILSNDDKRKEYDNELEAEEQEKINKIQNNKAGHNYTSNNQATEYNNEGVHTNRHYTGNIGLREEIQEMLRQSEERQREYQEEQERIYRKYLRSLGYKVKEKWTWKRFIKLLKLILLLFLILFIIWIFPPTHKMIVQTYEENRIIQVLCNSILNILKGIFVGIITFIKSIFAKN